MDAIQVLKAQHQEVDELFSQFEKARTRKMAIARQICEKLSIHDKIEREIFYPAVLENEEIKDQILEGLEEHHLVQILLKQIADIDESDETFEAKVTVLKEIVEHHVEEEEEEMFKAVRKALDKATLNELGARLEEATRSLQAQEPEVTITMLNEVTLETPKMG
jgi:thiaminase